MQDPTEREFPPAESAAATRIPPLENALRESEDRYQSLFNLCPDAIMVHAGGKYLIAHPAAVTLLGNPLNGGNRRQGHPGIHPPRLSSGYHGKG